MKRKILSQTLCLVALSAAAVIMSGCGTSRGYKGADKTGASIASFKAEILNGKKAIDATMTSLDAVAASAATDPRKAFEQYSKDVSNLESTAEKIKKRAQDMRERGQAYFDQWQKELSEVKNPDIQKLAQERQAKLKETFDNIKKTAEPLKAQFDPWMSDLKDLQKYLSNDLTIQGVDAAKPLFAKARTSGAEVQKSMDALVAELNTISATITAAKVQPQPAGSQTNAPAAK